VRGLSPSELLDVWERGESQRSHERALTILSAALPDRPEGLLEALSVGRRDGLLLTVRELTFGPTLEALTECPRCGERLELELETGAVRVEPRPRPRAAAGAGELRVGDWSVRFRAPSAADLAAAAGADGPEQARAVLLARCVASAAEAGQVRAVAELPGEVVQALAARMAELDPQADVRLALSCPACGVGWEEVFDVAAFFWHEISACAPRLLREVHALAAAYGWREADILAMGPRRRQAYLEMVGRWATS